MPTINQNQESLKYRQPRTLDREQLEYAATRTLAYGILIFAALGTCASIAYMTVQQLKK